jgi:hypothetical protein
MGLYQYKIVLVVPGCTLFRSGDMDSTLRGLQKINLADNKDASPYYGLLRSGIKTQDDLAFAFKLQAHILKLKDFDIRVESPFISIYSNSEKDVKSLAKLDSERVKYISKPPDNSSLTSNTILLPKINYEYLVTLGKTTQDNSAFVQWANNNKKLKLTKSCVRDLTKDRSWGGTYFYVTGDNNLLMTKMHLGGSINKVERIIKA